MELKEPEDLLEDEPSPSDTFHYIFQPFNTDDMKNDLMLINKSNLTTSVLHLQDLIEGVFTQVIADGNFKAKISKFCESFSLYNAVLNEIGEIIFLKTSMLFNSFLKYSLQIVFDERWAELTQDDPCKISLKEHIETCHNVLKKKNLLPKCLFISRILSIVSEPWQSPIFDKIFDNKESRAETKSYFEKECGSIFIERIRIMASSGCEDLAYKLVKKCYPLSSNYFKTVLHDLRLILMADQDKVNFTYELSLLEPADAMGFIKRLVELEGMDNVCKYMKTIHSKISSVLLRVIHLIMIDFMSKPIDCNYHDLCVLWVEEIFIKSENFHDFIRSLGDMSNSSAHLFILAEEILKKREECVNIDLSFCVELFTRVITINLNEFASTKISKEKKKAVSETLCKRFLRLAQLLPDCRGIRKECILTAFTLYPTQDLLKQILQMNNFLPKLVTVKQEVLSDEETDQIERDYTVSKDEIIFLQATRRLDALNNDQKGKLLTDSINYNHLEAPNIISGEGELMGLSKTLCDDLSILLLGSRQGNSISWAMDNIELQNACTDFMTNFATQYEEKELNYLKVDYSKFDNLPRPEIDEYCGIEKGYEQFLVEEEEYEEEPLPPKKKKKNGEENGEDFDYLYSDSDDSSKEQRKKKRYQRHSSSDSDFEPSSKKSKDKKLIKKRSRISKQNDENRGVKRVKSEFNKAKKINHVSNDIVRASYNVNKIKPCLRPSLIFKSPIKNKFDPVPEKKIKLLRLIRKSKFYNGTNDAPSLEIYKTDDKEMKTFVSLNHSVFNEPDRMKQISALNHMDREKHFDLCFQKNSISIKTKPQNGANNSNKVSLQQLLAFRPNFPKTDYSNTSHPTFKKGQPPDLNFPL